MTYSYEPDPTADVLAEVMTADVLAEVMIERARQDERWGEQNHPDVYDGGVGLAQSSRRTYAGTAEQWKRANDARAAKGRISWDGILLEEVFEALAESDPARLRAELIQVAAVAVNWVEAIDRRAPTEDLFSAAQYRVMGLYSVPDAQTVIWNAS